MTFIVWEIIREYFIGLWTYDHDRFIMTLDYMTLISPTLSCIYLTSLALLCICYFHCLHCPVILTHIVIPISHWYPWHCFQIIYIESHTILHLHWLIKLTKSGLLGGDCRRENLGMCAWKGDPLRVWMPHVILLFMCAHVITCFMIPEYNELFLSTIRIH